MPSLSRFDPMSDPERAESGFQSLALSALLTWSSPHPLTMILLETVAKRSVQLDPHQADVVQSACLVVDITRAALTRLQAEVTVPKRTMVKIATQVQPLNHSSNNSVTKYFFTLSRQGFLKVVFPFR